MSLMVLGLNHKLCPIEIREKFHFSESRLRETLAQAAQSADFGEIVILSTCNRVELYVCAAAAGTAENLCALLAHAHGIPQAVFRPYLYEYSGKEAVGHLFRVAAGLDSLVVGENEILGQIRTAFKIANEAGTVHSLLYRVFEKALKVGKEVRSRTKINEGAVSVSSVAVELAEKIFGKIAGEKLMVVGTGEMSMLTLKTLEREGAEASYIVSRPREKGEKLALEFGAEWVSMEDWQKYLVSVDILIASTSAPHPIITYEQIEKVMKLRRQRPLFLIDIAVPRDIDAQVNTIDDVYLYNVDDLKSVAGANLKRRQREIHQAESIVASAGLQYQAWLEQLKARPTLERFEFFLDEVLAAEIEKWPGRPVSPEEKAKFRMAVRTKLLHHPVKKIKEASENGGVERYLEALQSLFNLNRKDS